ncbi:hypothetical protein B14911_18850 [Bacillus sp. NRRL B-14911]|nr:hypothetical protein B14911_18850 [Bacillus sp. NRRL B-14911]
MSEKINNFFQSIELSLDFLYDEIALPVIFRE